MVTIPQGNEGFLLQYVQFSNTDWPVHCPLGVIFCAKMLAKSFDTRSPFVRVRNSQLMATMTEPIDGTALKNAFDGTFGEYDCGQYFESGFPSKRKQLVEQVQGKMEGFFGEVRREAVDVFRRDEILPRDAEKFVSRIEQLFMEHILSGRSNSYVTRECRRVMGIFSDRVSALLTTPERNGHILHNGVAGPPSLSVLLHQAGHEDTVAQREYLKQCLKIFAQKACEDTVLLHLGEKRPPISREDAVRLTRVQVDLYRLIDAALDTANLFTSRWIAGAVPGILRKVFQLHGPFDAPEIPSMVLECCKQTGKTLNVGGDDSALWDVLHQPGEFVEPYTLEQLRHLIAPDADWRAEESPPPINPSQASIPVVESSDAKDGAADESPTFHSPLTLPLVPVIAETGSIGDVYMECCMHGADIAMQRCFDRIVAQPSLRGLCLRRDVAMVLAASISDFYTAVRVRIQTLACRPDPQWLELVVLLRRMKMLKLGLLDPALEETVRREIEEMFLHECTEPSSAMQNWSVPAHLLSNPCDEQSVFLALRKALHPGIVEGGGDGKPLTAAEEEYLCPFNSPLLKACAIPGLLQGLNEQCWLGIAYRRDVEAFKNFLRAFDRISMPRPKPSPPGRAVQSLPTKPNRREQKWPPVHHPLPPAEAKPLPLPNEPPVTVAVSVVIDPPPPAEVPAIPESAIDVSATPSIEPPTPLAEVAAIPEPPVAVSTIPVIEPPSPLPAEPAPLPEPAVVPSNPLAPIELSTAPAFAVSVSSESRIPTDDERRALIDLLRMPGRAQCPLDIETQLRIWDDNGTLEILAHRLSESLHLEPWDPDSEAFANIVREALREGFRSHMEQPTVASAPPEMPAHIQDLLLRIDANQQCIDKWPKEVPGGPILLKGTSDGFLYMVLRMHESAREWADAYRRGEPLPTDLALIRFFVDVVSEAHSGGDEKGGIIAIKKVNTKVSLLGALKPAFSAWLLARIPTIESFPKDMPELSAIATAWRDAEHGKPYQVESSDLTEARLRAEHLQHRKKELEGTIDLLSTVIEGRRQILQGDRLLERSALSGEVNGVFARVQTVSTALQHELWEQEHTIVTATTSVAVLTKELQELSGQLTTADPGDDRYGEILQALSEKRRLLVEQQKARKHVAETNTITALQQAVQVCNVWRLQLQKNGNGMIDIGGAYAAVSEPVPSESALEKYRSLADPVRQCLERLKEYHRLVAESRTAEDERAAAIAERDGLLVACTQAETKFLEAEQQFQFGTAVAKAVAQLRSDLDEALRRFQHNLSQ